MKIMLDPGHGGQDPGAVGPSGLNEADVNLRVTSSMGPLLEQLGAKIWYTRTSDVYVSISGRCQKANKAEVDYFVSIHCNSNGPSAEGVETLVAKRESKAYKLAEAVQTKLVAATKDRDRWIKERPDLGVLAGTDMPAIPVEIGFISRPETEAKFKTEQYIGLIAEAITEGISSHLGLIEEKR